MLVSAKLDLSRGDHDTYIFPPNLGIALHFPSVDDNANILLDEILPSTNYCIFMGRYRSEGSRRVQTKGFTDDGCVHVTKCVNFRYDQVPSYEPRLYFNLPISFWVIEIGRAHV